MKKGIKLGLALAVGGLAQEGIAQTTQETNKGIQGVFAQAQDWKGGEKSNTYIATAADFKEKETTDILDVTHELKEITQSSDQLVKFYGKDGLNTKVHQIMEEYPTFGNLTMKQQETIVQQNFSDFINDTGGIVGVIAALLFTLWTISLRRSTRI